MKSKFNIIEIFHALMSVRGTGWKYQAEDNFWFHEETQVEFHGNGTGNPIKLKHIPTETTLTGKLEAGALYAEFVHEIVMKEKSK